MTTEAKESRDWEEVFAMTRWTPEKKGDELSGIFVKRRDNVGVRGYTFFTLQLSNGETRDVLGTTMLNPKMDQVTLGWEVRIVYQGEGPATPPHKPLKCFKVYRRPPLQDTTTGAAGEDEPGPSLVEGEDREAINTIEHYRKLLAEQNMMDTPEAIVKMAESDPDLEELDLSRLKAQLAREVQAAGGN